MPRTALALLMLGGCFGSFTPTPVRSDACACSLTPAPFMQSDHFGTPDQVLGFSKPISELYAVVESFPHGETGPVAHAHMIKLLAAEPPIPLQMDEVKYHTINGKEAASIEVVERIDNGVTVKKRYLIVDTGSNLIIAQFWTLKNRWTSHLEAIDSMAASLTFDRPAIETPYANAPEVDPQELPLLKARAAHETQISNDQAYTEPMASPPADGPWELTTYPSDVGPLATYVTKARNDGKRRPGVVFVEGGFGGPSNMVIQDQPSHNDQSAVAFQQAGFAVMIPAFRGEAGNPGRVEMFYGETFDLIKAVDFLKGRPDVDPDRIYLFGHSSGGSQVLNAAVATDAYRAAFVLGGRADLGGIMAEGGYGGEPFDINDRTEVRLRSPLHWAGHLKRPVFYFEGTGEFLNDAVTMAQHTDQMHVWPVPDGDHFTIQRPIKQLIVQQIANDTAAVPAFAFSEAALSKAMKAIAAEQAKDSAAGP